MILTDDISNRCVRCGLPLQCRDTSHLEDSNCAVLLSCDNFQSLCNGGWAFGRDEDDAYSNYRKGQEWGMNTIRRGQLMEVVLEDLVTAANNAPDGTDFRELIRDAWNLANGREP